MVLPGYIPWQMCNIRGLPGGFPCSPPHQRGLPMNPSTNMIVGCEATKNRFFFRWGTSSVQDMLGSPADSPVRPCQLGRLLVDELRPSIQRISGEVQLTDVHGEPGDGG